MLQTSIRNEQSMFWTLTKRKTPKRKIKMKMGKNVRKDATNREMHERTTTKRKHGKIQIVLKVWLPDDNMQVGHYLIKMEKTMTRKMWNSRYFLMYIFGIICSDSDVLALSCTLPPLFHTNSIMPVVCLSGRTIGTDISSVWLLGTTTLSPSSQQTWEQLLTVHCLHRLSVRHWCTWPCDNVKTHKQHLNQDISKSVMVHVNAKLL